IPHKDYFLYSIWKVDKNTAQSIYNIELAFKLLNKFKTEYHMLFLIGTEAQSDKSYLEQLIDKFHVTDSITIIYDQRLTDYLGHCKFLLRTNKIDGYGVSLQEAIHFNIPAVASDVCTRPKGTVLFKNDNFEDLSEKVQHLHLYWKPSEAELPVFHVKLLELYETLLGKR